MRVAIFFDGKNFHSGWKHETRSRPVDFSQLAKWLVEAAGGNTLWGAYYYTGVERGEAADSEGQRKLAKFLEMLEHQRGFFVKRFPRKAQRFECSKCGHETRYSQEKEVDTTMVADMLRLAAVDAFDAAILVSGDADHAPAVEGVRALGKQVFVASWGRYGLSPRIRKAAFDHLDLMGALESQPVQGKDVAPDTIPQASRVDASGVFLAEVEKAEKYFGGSGGYVGVNYFLTSWRSQHLDLSQDARRRLMDKLKGEGRLEVYDAPDGKKALRVVPS